MPTGIYNHCPCKQETKDKISKANSIALLGNIPWEQIEMYLTKKEYKKFMKWMYCQTVPIGGVYRWDLNRFLDGLPVID